MSQETTVRVPLTVEERAERADIMAGLLAQIAAVKRQKAEADEDFNKDIKALEARLQEHGNVLREGAEERAQMDLTFPQEQAAKALHDVAAAACTCEGGPEAEVKAPTCPVHGVESRGENLAVDEQGAIPVGDGAEAAADFVVPEETAVEMLASDLEAAGVVPEVETIAPETPPVVDEFIAAQKSRRRKRA